MSLSTSTSRQPRAVWGLPATTATLLATVALLYLAAWPAQSSWQWVPVLSLAYLVCAAVTIYFCSHPWDLVASYLSGAAMLPLVLRGWQTVQPTGLLVSLGIVALLGPAWAYLLRALRARGAAVRRSAEQIDQAQLLSTLSRAFRVEESLPKMLDRVAQSIGEAMDPLSVCVSLVEGQPPVLHNEAAFGLAPAAVERLRQSKFPLASVHEAMRPEFGISQSFCMPLDRAHPWVAFLQTVLLRQELIQESTPCLLVVPMYDRAQQTVGIIALAFPEQRCPPNLALVEMLEVLAQHAAAGLHSHRLYSDLERRLNDLVLINDIGQAITSGLDQDTVLEDLVDASAQLLNSDYSALYYWDEVRRQLAPRVSHGFSPEQDSLLTSPQVHALIKGVVQEGAPLLTNDITDDPAFGAILPHDLPLCSVLIVPLVASNRVSGALMTGASRRNAFDDTDRILLSTLADQASVAIQNARLYESAARRMGQLATLNDIGTAIISSLDIDVTLSQIMDNVQETFNVESGSLLLERDGKLEFTVFFGPAGDRLRTHPLELGQGIAGWVAMTGLSVLVPDAKQDERHFAGLDQITGYETHSLLCVPLMGPGDQVIGVLEIMNPRDGHAFTREDQELLESIATFAVVSIQNAQLYAQTMCHLTDLSGLYEVGKAITASLDIEDTLQIIARETAKLTAGARSRIVLFDSQAGRVTYAVQHGYDDASAPTTTYDQTWQGLSGWVLGEKIPTMSADLHQDERMRDASAEQVAGPGAQSMIIAPLLIKDEPVGTLNAVRLEGAEPFAERELGLLNMMAGQAAVAIENAHFFEERKRQITELSILNQTGQALSSTLEPRDLMDLIHTQVAQVMDAQSMYIALYDPDKDLVSFPLAYEHGIAQIQPGLDVVPQDWQPRQNRRGITEYIIKAKQALWIPNRVQERLQELGIEAIGQPALSWMGVPILWGDQVLGVIAVQSYDREDVYDREHLDLLMTIAGQASAAIRNAQLFARVNTMTENLERLVAERTEALAKANENLTIERDRLNVLYLITRELSSSLEPERALSRTLVLINRALQAHQGYILLLDSASESLVYTAVVGETPLTEDGEAFPTPRPGDRAGYRQDPGIIGWLVTRQNLIRAADLRSDTRWHIVPDQDRWHRSLLAAPLLTGNDVVGAIVLCHAQAEHFTTDHERMLAAIASQVAVSVSNAEMFRLLREAADRLGTMLRSQQLEAANRQAILEGVADGVMVTDAKGKIALFNAAAERILQVHRADVIGHPVSELPGIFGLAGTSWTELAELWAEDEAEAGSEVLYDERLELDERVISVRVAPVRRQGTFEGTVSAFRDITKDVEVDRMKSEFVSSVSHELRTPMTSIKGYIDLLHSGMAGPVSDEQKRFLQIVKTNADRLTLLVNDLLDISRIETGRLKLTIESVDPIEIVNLVLTNHRPDADKRQQTLQSAIEGPLPPVRADPSRMTQILTNLVSNAIHYTPTGGTIRVDAEVVSDLLHIHVQDTGVGIKQEDQAKMFSRFFRADTPLVQARSGTGLGLAIVKSIVELHGGEIWFESAFGQGSTFSFSLPLADQEMIEEPQLPREFRTISYRRQDKHILIIEGELDIADLISHQLRSQGGYRVHIEHSGRQALHYLEEDGHRTDLILLDLSLPERDGLDVLQDLLDHKGLTAIPIVALSLSHREGDGQRADTRAYLSRPTRSNRLLDAISAIFAGAAEDLNDRAGSVLVAENDRQLAELFTKVLTAKGLNVAIQQDADQVVRTARSRQPDLILLDVTRSDVDGFAILERLKDEPATRGIPVLVTTGPSLDMQEPQQDMGVNALQFVDGPVEVDELVGEIQQMLDEHQDSPTPPG